MTHTSGKRQYLAVAALLVLSGLAAHFGYREVHGDRVLLRRAETLLEARREEPALAAYRAAVERGSRDTGALMRLIEADLAADDLPAARRHIALLVLESGADRGRLGELAGMLDSMGRADLALSALQQAEPGILTPEQQLHMADLLRRTGRFEPALEIYARLRDEFPVAALLEAETLAWAGEPVEAERLARHLLAADPGDPRVRLLLARVLSWQGRTEEAIEQYTRYLGDAP